MPVGWDPSEWGLSGWGPGAEQPLIEYPVIVALDPVEDEVSVHPTRKIHVRITDNDAIRSNGIYLVLSGTYLVYESVAINGAQLEITPNDGNGYDILVTPPNVYPNNSKQEVIVIAVNNSELITSKLYYFHVGVGLRLLSASNPQEGFLRAFFTRPLTLNDDYYDINNWTVTPISDGALPLQITEVVSAQSQADQGILRYIGGGGTYLLTVKGVVGLYDQPLEEGYDSATFVVVFSQDSEPVTRYIDTVYGPMGVTHQTVAKVTIDTHTADRAAAVAIDKQLAIRYKRTGQNTEQTLGKRRAKS